MQFVNQRAVGLTALAFAVASCAAPMAGVGPMGAPSPATVASGAPPVSSTPTPAPAAAPSLPPAPPMAKDARARLTGVVLFNDTPVADASLTALDLATGKAIALTPWSEVPKGLKLLSTQKTDAKGAFDFELPKLDDKLIVKLVATKGGQTFTALFNSRGQALGADTPSAATYQLQQGTAVAVTIRLRLTAATTAATQAFEGALKLTFQLPEGISAERQSAILEAARKAAQQVEEALAKQPEVAARLVASINSAGETNQLENFRTAVTNLGVFDSLFKATQAELLAVAAQTLVVRDGLAPIMARDFPLDRVVISPSGLLGFSGQRNPIKLGGAVTSNFVPSNPGGSGGGSGGSGGSADTGGGGLAPEDTAFAFGGIQSAMGLGLYGSNAPIPSLLRDNILVTDVNQARLYRFSATSQAVASFTLPLISSRLSGVAAVDDSTTTIMVSSDAGSAVPSVARYAWDDSASTYTLEASGGLGLKAGGGVVAGGRYWQFSGTRSSGEDFIRSWPLTGDLDDTASQTLTLTGGGNPQLSFIPGNTAPGAFSLAVDANVNATHVYWVTAGGKLFRYSDDGVTATATVIADFPGAVYGGVALAPGGNRLYVATKGNAYYVDDPATGTTVVPNAFASVPTTQFVFSGAQTRPGSVVFAIFGNPASSVVRVPTPQ